MTRNYSPYNGNTGKHAFLNNHLTVWKYDFFIPWCDWLAIGKDNIGGKTEVSRKADDKGKIPVILRGSLSFNPRSNARSLSIALIRRRGEAATKLTFRLRLCKLINGSRRLGKMWYHGFDTLTFEDKWSFLEQTFRYNI